VNAASSGLWTQLMMIVVEKPGHAAPAVPLDSVAVPIMAR